MPWPNLTSASGIELDRLDPNILFRHDCYPVAEGGTIFLPEIVLGCLRGGKGVSTLLRCAQGTVWHV